MNLITAIFESIKALFVFGTKVAPSEKIQEERFEAKKQFIFSNERNKIFDEFFQDLKDHTELSIEDKVNFELMDMDSQSKAILIEMLEERIMRYRKSRPIKFRKYLSSLKQIQ